MKKLIAFLASMIVFASVAMAVDSVGRVYSDNCTFLGTVRVATLLADTYSVVTATGVIIQGATGASVTYGITAGTATVTGLMTAGSITTAGALSVGSATDSGASTITGLLTVSSATASGYFQFTSRTAAVLKALTPTAVGQAYYDSTNKAVVVSTGTGVGAFGLITTGGAPTGW